MRRDNLFLWTVFILLLIAFAFACWIGSYYVFGHPENPRSYKILKTLKKVEQPKRFELTAAPPGEFLNPQKLYDRYIAFSPLALQNENEELMRNYINNYQATKKLVPYVVGKFNILDSFELKKGDLFESGVVALAQADDFPQLLIEHVYTADQKNVPVLRKMLMTGLDIKLEKTLDLAAIVHIEKIYDGRLQFTVVPLLYGTYALKQGSGNFSLEPPADLHLEAGAPVVKTAMLSEAFKTFAQYRKKLGGGPKIAAASAPSATPASAELVRVEPTPMPDEAPTPTPAPVAMATPKPTPTAKFATPPPIAQATPSATPVMTTALATPRPTPAIENPRPTPTPQPTSPEGVPLQPFLVSAPTPNVAAPGASWRVYPPGQMPRGKLVDVRDITELADRGVGGERLYLRGSFVVTASGENRAVLRSGASGGLGALVRGGSGATRVIVEFPAGNTPPTEGAAFARDELRPFLITDVRRGADGQINVYVREVTTQ